MSSLFVVLVALTATFAHAADPAPPPLPPAERDALSLVDVMPILEVLAAERGYAGMPTEALRAFVAASARTTLADPFRVDLGGPDRVVELFATIGALRELHRRHQLRRAERRAEVTAALHLMLLGVRAQTDPLLDRRLRAWRDAAVDDAERQRLRALVISVQAAREIGERWFPEAVMVARQMAPDDEALAAQIGVWMAAAGGVGEGVDFLRSLGAYGRDRALAERALYLALTGAKEDEAAAALIADVRATGSPSLGALRALEAAEADRTAELRFRIAKRPRPAAEVVAHARRVAADRGAIPAEVEAARALVSAEAGDAPEALRFLVDAAWRAGDRAALEGLAGRAQAAGEAAVSAEIALLDAALAARSDAGATGFGAALDAVAAGDAGRRASLALAFEVASWSAGGQDPAETGGLARAARRLGKRADPGTRRLAAASLVVVGAPDAAAKVLIRGDAGLPAADRAQARLDAARVVTAACAEGGPDRSRRARAWIASAEGLGASPTSTLIARALVDVVAARGVDGRLSEVEAGRIGADLAYATLRPPDGAPSDLRVDALVAFAGLDAASRLDATTERAAAAWAVQPDHPLRPVFDAAIWLAASQPLPALRALGARPEAPIAASYAWASWQRAACAAASDASCVEDLGRRLAVDGARLAAPTPGALPSLLPVSARGASVDVGFSATGTLAPVAALPDWPIPVALPGETRPSSGAR